MPLNRSAKPEFSNKRPRLEGTTPKLVDASQLRSALHTDNPDSLTETLTSLRNQLTLKSHELKISPQDERLILVKQWVEQSPGAQDLFEIWDKANSRQSSLIALVISTFSAVLALLSSHYTDHALGQPIMKTLLTPSKLRQLNSYIGGSHNELIIVTMKLYNVMSKFAGGRDRKLVLEGFGWEIKSLPKLLNMRRKIHGTQDRTDPLLRPDIRTLYVLFLLSFLDVDSNTQTKTTFIDQRRDAFLAIFKGIAQDHYSLARKILEVCWAGVWSDSKLKRTLKVGLFNETTIAHLLKLYDRVQPDDDDEDRVPADLVHHFLLAICSRPGSGICFKDRGWYPRESDTEAKDDEDSKRRTEKIYNKILANVLKTLKVNEDSRQQELAIKILMACPELTAGYWSAAALTLEPRLSSKWITNVSFFGSVIALPPPTLSFYLPNTQLYQPTPPPLSTILENILPSVNTKNNFSRGLQSTSALVQHCTALALCKCLVKFQTVLSQFREIVAALEEDPEEGQWSKRCRDLEREVRKRVPEFQVVVAFSQKPSQPQTQTNETKSGLLAESAQRLLGLYHRCMPSVVAEARFDIGKLLGSFSAEDRSRQDASQDAAAKLCRVQQLHILGMLKDNEQFIWAVKVASLSHTPFYVLLNALATARLPAIRSALRDLLRHILSQSVLFQEDRHEPELWLRALPRKRPRITEDPDQHPGWLEDEADAVITFLDDCVQRCLKTPYRYVEALHSITSAPTSLSADSLEASLQLDTCPSPLIMTVIEQLEAKVNNKSLSSSHLLGVVSYIRRVLFYLVSKCTDTRLLEALADKVASILVVQNLPEASDALRYGVQRELGLLHAGLTFPHSPSNVQDVASEIWQDYLQMLGKITIAEDLNERSRIAWAIIDQVRISGQTPNTEDLKQLVNLVNVLDRSAVSAMIEHLNPIDIDLWAVMDLAELTSKCHPHLSFEWLYLHTGHERIRNDQYQVVLHDVLFREKISFIQLNRALHMVMHGISRSRNEQTKIGPQIALLSRILKSAKGVLPSSDIDAIKTMIFLRSSVIKELLLSSSSSNILGHVEYLIDACLQHTASADRIIVSDISNHWFNILNSDLGYQSQPFVSTACLWIAYLEPAQLLHLLDILQIRASNVSSSWVSNPITAILKTLASKASTEWEIQSLLTRHIPRFLALRPLLSGSPILEEVISIAVGSSLPMGIDARYLPFLSTEVESNCTDLVAVIRQCESRWLQRKQLDVVDVDIRQFVSKNVLSASTVNLLSGLAYRNHSLRESLGKWIASDECLDRPIDQLIPIFHAFLDTSSSTTIQPLSGKVWAFLLPSALGTLSNDRSGLNERRQAQSLLTNFFSACYPEPSTYLQILALELPKLHTFTPQLFAFGSWLARTFGSKTQAISESLVHRGIQLCIDDLAEGVDRPDTEMSLVGLTSLVQASSISKAHLVETLLSVIIQHHLSSPAALRLGIASLSSCQLKPVVVNRHLQGMIQHPHFFKYCTAIAEESTLKREALIELLHTLFNLYPNNTCQITHIEPLIRIYRGTANPSDIRVLSIFQLFEGQRKLSVAPLLARWSATPATSSTSALEALLSLDPAVVLKTCLSFPQWRQVESQFKFKVQAIGNTVYDPVFLMLLFGQIITEQPPDSPFAWVETFRTNVVSLLIRALSAKDGQIRELALCQLVALWRQMENADMQEKPHVQYILSLLKDLIPNPSSLLAGLDSRYPRRLPTYTSLILMHSLRGIFHPSNFIYPLTSRFLLQRPSLDTSDVPMLYGMLYSSSDDNWKKERAWIIRFLADGMVSSEDWKVLKRRHTWDLLSSLFQSSEGDSVLRLGILEILANLTCNAQATTSLILKLALLPWVEMQLLSTGTATLNAHGVEWIKILENILVIVEAGKMEVVTNGEWRASICRCLMIILDEKKSIATAENFPHAVPLIFRLASLEGPPLQDLPILLQLAVDCLKKIEVHIQLPTTDISIESDDISLDILPPPPHRSHTLHHRVPFTPGTTDALKLWGKLVEMLWHSSMLTGSHCAAWDALTPRMLLWGTFVGGSRAPSAEWVRKETIASLQYPGYIV